MNELIEPFLDEARELIEAASDDLLALDSEPGDAGHLENLFRCFHTLKGSAALLDFGPMLVALHAAEDLLSAVRAGSAPISTAAIQSCLEALDQVGTWVDAIERSGELPSDAAPRGAELAASLRSVLGSAGRKQAARGDTAIPVWVRQLVSREADATRKASQAGRPGTALRYIPQPDCFLNGDDPLAIVSRVPELLAVGVEPREPWPPHAEMDPFSCNLAITVLSGASREEIAPLFRLVSDQVELCELPASGADTGASATGPVGAAIIAEQHALLATDHPRTIRDGVERSALTCVANVLTHEGLGLQAERLRRAAQAGGRDALALIEEVIAGPAPAAAEVDVAPAAAAATRHLRVDAARVDALAGLVSELNVARNTLAHLLAQAEAEVPPETLLRSLRESDAAIGRLAGDLHRSVMQIRMVPLSGVFRRFARPVREMAAQLGKEVAFDVSGEDTEVDRTIAEGLFELLLHVLRNAIDHGLEPPDMRLAAGKPRRGRIALSARPERDRVIVSVVDDGRGIDPAAIRRIALERRLISPEAAANLPDREAIDLIFAPGFSTAASVTDLSGRGVGMDAVRSGAQRLGGRVELESRPGSGTTIALSLPQAMILTPLMMVRAGHETFGLPLGTVVEIQRVSPSSIVAVKAGRALVWRDRTIPVLSLPDRMGIAAAPSGREELEMLVVRLGGEPAGLLVDGVLGRLEAVVRPLGGVFAGIPGLSGTTILGDGRILLVLDVEEALL